MTALWGRYHHDTHLKIKEPQKSKITRSRSHSKVVVELGFNPRQPGSPNGPQPPYTPQYKHMSIKLSHREMSCKKSHSIKKYYMIGATFGALHSPLHGRDLKNKSRTSNYKWCPLRVPTSSLGSCKNKQKHWQPFIAFLKKNLFITLICFYVSSTNVSLILVNKPQAPPCFYCPETVVVL